LLQENANKDGYGAGIFVTDFAASRSVVGHSRRFDRVQLTSSLTPQADIIADRRHVSKVPILLQKSFWGDERQFSATLTRVARGDVRDHFVPRKNDHEPA